MKKGLLVLLSILLVLCSAVTLSAKSAQETTMIFIEAEDCELSGYTAVDKEGAVGKAITSATSEEDSFTVHFSVPSDGQYVLWLKVMNASQSDNSLKYSLNDEEKVFDFAEFPDGENADYPLYNHWYWLAINERGTEPLENGWTKWGEANGQVRHTPVILDLKAGDQSLTFISREAGHLLDQVIITDDLTYNPANVPGNKTLLCDFCNMEHFLLEPYADFGKTPEQLWKEKISTEIAAQAPVTQAPVTEAPVIESVSAIAPQTMDNNILLLSCMLLLSGISIFLLKKAN